MLFLSNDLHEKASQKVKISRDDILISRALSIICPRVTTLHSCYIKKCTCFQPIISALFLHISYCDGKMTLHNVAFEY